jgi:hypothetical protein
MPITTVSLTNTFDEWRIKTNQTIVALDDDSTGILRGNTTLTGSIILTNPNKYGSNVTLNVSSGMIKGDGGLLTNLTFQGVNTIQNVVTVIYNTSNTVYNLTNTAYNTANAAFDVANAAATSTNAASGFSVANAAFNKANAALANTTTTYVGDLTVVGKVIHTGRYSQTVTAVSASAIDCSQGNYFTKTASSGLTWTFTNVPASGAYVAVLELTNGGTGTQTWPAAVKWPSGVAPVLTTSGVDLLVFITDDGGTNWRGLQSMRDSK